MSRGRHTMFAPHWPSPDDVLTASPHEIGAVAAAYQQGVKHREEKGQPVPKAIMFKQLDDWEAQEHRAEEIMDVKDIHMEAG